METANQLMVELEGEVPLVILSSKGGGDGSSMPVGFSMLGEPGQENPRL